MSLLNTILNNEEDKGATTAGASVSGNKVETQGVAGVGAQGGGAEGGAADKSAGTVAQGGGAGIQGGGSDGFTTDSYTLREMLDDVPAEMPQAEVARRPEFRAPAKMAAPSDLPSGQSAEGTVAADKSAGTVAQGNGSAAGVQGGKGAGKRDYTLMDIYEAMKKEDEEDLEKERKRHKSRALIAAIGDGIGAMADMVGAYNYAPVKSDPSASLSARQKAWWDKLVAERRALSDKKWTRLLNIKTADDARQAATEKNELLRAYYESVANKNNAQANQTNTLTPEKVDSMKVKRENEKKSLDLKEKKTNKEIDLIDAKTKKAEADTRVSDARASGKIGSGRGGKGGKGGKGGSTGYTKVETTEKVDPYGNKTITTKTTTKGATGKAPLGKKK